MLLRIVTEKCCSFSFFIPFRVGHVLILCCLLSLLVNCFRLGKLTTHVGPSHLPLQIDKCTGRLVGHGEKSEQFEARQKTSRERTVGHERSGERQREWERVRITRRFDNSYVRSPWEGSVTEGGVACWVAWVGVVACQPLVWEIGKPRSTRLRKKNGFNVWAFVLLTKRTICVTKWLDSRSIASNKNNCLRWNKQLLGVPVGLCYANEKCVFRLGEPAQPVYRPLSRPASPLDIDDVTQRVRQQNLISRFNDLFTSDRLDALNVLMRYSDDHENNQRIVFAVMQVTLHCKHPADRASGNILWKLQNF